MDTTFEDFDEAAHEAPATREEKQEHGRRHTAGEWFSRDRWS